MPEVAFHTGLDDKLGYACRLVRKAWRQGAQLRISADAPTLARLDALLWTFEPAEFLAHVRVRPGEAPAPGVQAATRIWLSAHAAACPPCPVLVNLGPDIDADGTPKEKIIELVGADDAERQTGHARWRHYKTLGWPMTHIRTDAHEPPPPGRAQEGAA